MWTTTRSIYSYDTFYFLHNWWAKEHSRNLLPLNAYPFITSIRLLLLTCPHSNQPVHQYINYLSPLHIPINIVGTHTHMVAAYFFL